MVCIRIQHEFVDRIDTSLPRITVWHHQALSSDAKQLPEEKSCLSFSQTHAGFFSLHGGPEKLYNFDYTAGSVCALLILVLLV